MLRSQQRILSVAALAAGVSTAAGAQSCADESRSNIRPGFGLARYVQSVQWTHPIGLNISVGCSAANSWPRVHPVLLTDIGINGGSVVVGLGSSWRRAGDLSRGLQLRAVATRTWGDPWAVGPDQTFAGFEIRALYQTSFGVGVLHRVDAGGRGQRILTASVGIGL